jgi:hypothetical protein
MGGVDSQQPEGSLLKLCWYAVKREAMVGAQRTRMVLRVRVTSFALGAITSVWRFRLVFMLNCAGAGLLSVMLGPIRPAGRGRMSGTLPVGKVFFRAATE